MQFDTLKDILILLHTTGNNQQMMLLQRQTRPGDCYEWRHDDYFARLVLNTFLTTREKWSLFRHLTATAHSLMNCSTFTNHCNARVFSSLGGELSSDQVDVVDLTIQQSGLVIHQEVRQTVNYDYTSPLFASFV